MCPSCLHKNPLKPPQRATLNPHSVALSQVRPWLVGKTRRDDGLYRINFGFIHRHRQASVPDDPNYPRGRKNGQSIMKIQAAKHVAGKQWGLDQLDSVGPEFAASAKWKERIITPASKRVRDAEFMFGMHLQSEPRELGVGGARLL